MLRRGPSGRRPMSPRARARRGRSELGRTARGATRRSRRALGGRARRGRVGSDPAAKRSAITSRTTSDEPVRRSTTRSNRSCNDLRRAVRRQRTASWDLDARSVTAPAIGVGRAHRWCSSRSSPLRSRRTTRTPGRRGRTSFSAKPSCGRSRCCRPPSRRCSASSRTTSCTDRSPPTRASRRSMRPSAGTAIRGTSAWRSSTARATIRCARSRSAICRTSPPTPSRTTTSCPTQLAITSSTSGFGHSYWESRFETHLGSECARRARELILIDHSRSDGLLDRVLSPTIFSTPTNRRIFRGMVIVADNESWQRIFQMMTEKSRWDLPDDDVARYLARSYDFVMDLLIRMDRAEPFRLDPSGHDALGWRSASADKCCARAAIGRCAQKPIGTSACRPDAAVRDVARRNPLRARDARRKQLIHPLGVGAAA